MPRALFQVNSELWLGANSPRTALFLSSEDGRVWRDRSPDVVEPGTDVAFRAVAKGPPGWALLTEEGAVDARHLGVRFSGDGQRWSIVGADILQTVDGLVAVGAIWGRDSYTIVGYRPETEGFGTTIVFSSPDGIDWTQEHAAALTLEDWSVPVAVVEVSGRRIVVTDSGSGGRVSALESAQRGQWRRHVVADLEASRIHTAGAYGSVLMLGGCSNDPDVQTAEVWSLSDSLDALPTLTDIGDAADGCIYGFGVGPHDALALGKSTTGAAAWSSSDSIGWRREALFGTTPSRALTGTLFNGAWVAAGERIEVTSSPPTQVLKLWRRTSS